MDSHKHSTQVERLEVVETGRRRRWSDDEKLRIVMESLQTTRAISSTARRHGISRSLLMTWRRQVERLEVVETGRRRRWSDDEKLRIVMDCRRLARYHRQRDATAYRAHLLMTWRLSFSPEPTGFSHRSLTTQPYKYFIE